MAPAPETPGLPPEGADEAPPTGAGRPGGKLSLEQIRRQIEELHHRAETAAEAYNGAKEKAARQRRQITSLNRRTAVVERKLKKLNKQAGALARAQYRSGGVPDAARLVLSGDPDDFLRKAGLAGQGRQAAKGFLANLKGTRKRLDTLAGDALDRWTKLEKTRKAKARAKKRVKARLEQAEKLESRLAADERKRLRKLERDAARVRQERWLRSGAADGADDAASAKGRKAVAYATAQIGRDYEWGSEGPRTFDCSGLTMRAWEAAGVKMPRTSQKQWSTLPRVPVREMRPGDLIIYKRDASHVGMYVGDGIMVHAPRTGRKITSAGAGSMPILGVVRPDG